MKTGSDKIEGVLGAVLAGGVSRRMGQDKALLEFEGQTLIERAIDVLETAFDEVVIVAPKRQRYVDLEAELVPDIRPGLGPVGGIHTALGHGAGRSVFVLACDMPYVTAELVRWITGSDGGNTLPTSGDCRAARPTARVARDHHGAQPLCGLYSHGCLSPVEEALNRHRLSAQELLGSLETEYLDLDSGVVWYSPSLLANVNALQDFADLTERPGQDP